MAASTWLSFSFFYPPPPFYSTQFTLFLLTTDSTTQHELYQLPQLSDISQLSYKVHIWQVLIWHLVTEYLLIKNTVRSGLSFEQI